MKVCPKCKQKTEADQCGSCKLVFAEYEQQKGEQTAQVYRLISAGELDQAKELAQNLSNEFPDSKGDFVLLISNINRDLSVAAKYRKAQELFNQDEYGEAIVLLRNIKAFDPGLAEKVIALRRRAERHSSHKTKFEQAAELFEQKQYGEARKLLFQISGSDSRRKEEIGTYLGKIDEVKSGLLHEITDCLAKQLFNAAREKLGSLSALFPESGQEQAGLAVLMDRRREISARLAAAAHKAKEERRFLEAKALYTFIIWQDQELKAALTPYLEEIGPQPMISLRDCGQDELELFAASGIVVTEEGLLRPVPTERDFAGRQHAGEHLANIAAVSLVPESLPDLPNEPLDIDGEDVADFV